MKLQTWWLGAVIAVWAAVPAAAQGILAGGDFEKEWAEGWEIQAENGAQVSLSTETPAHGKTTALLQTANGSRGWLLTPPLSGVKTGDTVLLNFMARRVNGQAALVLNVVGDASQLTEAVVWEAVLPPGANWRRLSLVMKIPPLAEGQPPRLAWGVMGPAGAWSLDQITVTSAPSTLPLTAPGPAWGQAWQTSKLPADWVPDDNLEATVRTLGTNPELSINVNGIEIGCLPELTGYRGIREVMTLYAVNRGKVDKTMEIELAGPPGVTSPQWSLPVKADGTTRFHLTVQSLQSGSCWLKLTCRSGDQAASLPIKYTTHRAYPVLGTIWHQQVEPQRLHELGELPLAAHLLTAPAKLAAFEPMVEAVRDRVDEYLLAPEVEDLTTQQYHEALTPLAARLQPSFWLPWALTPSAVTAGTAAGVELAEQLKAAHTDNGVLLPTLRVQRDWLKGGNRPVESRVLQPDRITGLMALPVSLPRLGAPVVMMQQIDGQADSPSGGLVSLSRQSELGTLRNYLTEQQLALPLLVNSLQGESSGDERLDALCLARTMIEALSQGATGVLLEAAQPTSDNSLALGPVRDDSGQLSPAAAVVRELALELASATPLVPIAASPEVRNSPEASVTFKPFLRGGEGIVALWNNTGISREISLEFIAQPVMAQIVRFSYQGDFVTRRWDPIYKFSDEAYKRHLPLHLLRIDPLDVVILTFRLTDPHPAWLKGIYPTLPIETKSGPAMPPTREQRTWWRDMLGGRGRTSD